MIVGSQPILDQKGKVIDSDSRVVSRSQSRSPGRKCHKSSRVISLCKPPTFKPGSVSLKLGPSQHKLKSAWQMKQISQQRMTMPAVKPGKKAKKSDKENGKDSAR